VPPPHEWNTRTCLHVILNEGNKEFIDIRVYTVSSIKGGIMLHKGLTTAHTYTGGWM